MKDYKEEKATQELPFKVSARAGKLLGRENFSNAEGAIIELVKNSYDADAKNCFVVFDIPFILEVFEDGTERKVLQNHDAKIYIIDNGEGMDSDIIRDNWMQIGTGNKEKNYISPDERIKTGAKGIGRFALDRLGYKTEMITLSKSSMVGYKWQMDWTQFDNPDQTISDITASITPVDINLKDFVTNIFSSPELKKADFSSGTVLQISNLKDDWIDENIENVYKSLEALIPPKELNIGFDVNFRHLQKPKSFGKVETAFFNDYDYKVFAIYNAEQLKVDIEITRNEIDITEVKKKYAFLFKEAKAPYDLSTLEKKVFKYSRSINELFRVDLTDEMVEQLINLGPFEMTFYYLKFIVSQKEEYPYKPINQRERRSVIDRFGGVKIYRDSFRVRPYGDPNNDWLKLGSRVSQSPAGAGQRIGDWRVRPEPTAAIIKISRKNNPLLIDKSDRGSLQENETFETFRNLIIRIIHEFELDRSRILNIFYKNYVNEKTKAQEAEIDRRAQILAEEIVQKRKDTEEKVYGSLKKTPDLFQQKREEEEKKTYEDAFKDTFKRIENERIENDNEEIVQVRALASLGLIVSSFSHELKEIRNNVHDIADLDEGIEKLIPEQIKEEQEFIDIKNIVTSLKSDTQKIVHWIDYSLNAIKKDKRKRSNLDLHKYFDLLLKDWDALLAERNIKLIIHKDKQINYSLRAFEMDMGTIFSNLISNSIDAFDNLKIIRDRTIQIYLNTKADFLEILFSDNGPGLSKSFDHDRESIFQPFVTSKIDQNGKEIGTGLGMYLVKSVVNDYNGEVALIDQTPGFHLKLFFPLRKT